MEGLELEDSMATTSIMHNFIVSNPESVAKFAKALEEAANDPPRHSTVSVRHLSDPDEIREFMERVKQANAQRNEVELQANAKESSCEEEEK